MRWVFGISLGLALGAGTMLAWAAPGTEAPRGGTAGPSPEAVRFFETKIRPLLAQECFACHGERSHKGGLRLDTAEGVREGGDSGPALLPGDPDGSLLIRVLRYDGPVKMPPRGRLKPQQLEDLVTWVRIGAPWPSQGPTPGVKGPEPTGKGQGKGAAGTEGRHWAFQPVKRPAVPAVKNRWWVKNPVDAFVLARLERKGLKPSPYASRRELIRRAFFDLTGLPPAPEEVEAFVSDRSPDAYEKLIDRLLASPRFGERWGRHWLDVVRFAQTNGYERDGEKPHAWRYRDYVIRSFNEDRPYDLFIKEQLAGDELDAVTDDSLTATAFYRLGVWDDEPDEARQAEFDNLDDILSTTGQAFLGLTVGCARCHDHKFDPIPQEEYYGLLAFIRNVKRYANPDDKNPNPGIFAELKGGEKTLAVHEYGPDPLKTHVLIRGNAATPGAEVAPRFIQALCESGGGAVPELPARSPNGRTTGRRRVLAEWIASPEHPLTARVMVNRVWQHLFGRGIVATPNDFGRTGEAPTQPELLDWLASGFSRPPVDWSVKRLVKLVMLSATYQQSSRVRNASAAAADPANTLLWRQNMRRLEAEAIRDAILATSGKLNLKMGGRGIFPKLSQEVLSTQSRPGDGWDDCSEEERSRRSVYIFVKRTLGVPFLETFDAATPDNPVAARQTTTIAPQALILLNSEFMEEQADAFAERLSREAGADPGRQIERAFRLALGRSPTAVEAEIAGRYLERQQDHWEKTAPEQAGRRALASFCKLVLNLNEFVYVD